LFPIIKRIGIINTAAGFVLLIMLSACNMPGKNTPTPSGFDQISTSAAQTVMAQLTQVSGPPAGTLVPTFAQPTSTFGVPLPTPVLPSPKSPETATAEAASGSCDMARFVKDVTVSDNTEFAPGATFIKTWKLQNAGTCTWTTAYQVVFVKGDKMGAPDAVPIPQNVPPGSTVDVSVSMQAPNTPGVYRGDWKLRNPSGQIFGTDKKNAPFYVQIVVAEPTTGGSILDFVSKSKSASWYSGLGNNLPGNPLTFNGAIDDPNGYAGIRDGVLMENGQTSGKLLMTIPRREQDGYVYGLYPAYTVRPGDHFRARIGFAANADNKCGGGEAVFLLAYLEGTSVVEVQEWRQSCDGQMLKVDLSLANLAGKTLQFILVVQANGSFLDDFAIWNSPIIGR